MKFTADRTQFSAAIAMASRALATETSLPILTNILLDARDGALRLVCTNLKIAITRTIPCAVSEDGTVTVPGHRLGEWVSAVQDNLITCDLDRKTITLRMAGGRSKATLRGIDAEDFPSVPTTDEHPTATIDAAELAQAVAAVAFAAVRGDSNRPVLGRVCCIFEGDRLTLVAADGFRMAVRHVFLTGPAERDVTVIVPVRAMQGLAAAVADAESPVELTITKGNNQLIARAPGVEYLTRLIHGSYPDWQQIVPKSHESRAVVDRASLLQAVKLVEIFAKTNEHVVICKVAPAEDTAAARFTIEARGDGTGDSASEMDASLEGPADRVGMNGTYLADALRAVRGTGAIIQTGGPSRPIVVKGVTDNDATQIIMPMSVKDHHVPGPEGGEEAPAPEQAKAEAVQVAA